jgi:hypothetical protein
MLIHTWSEIRFAVSRGRLLTLYFCLDKRESHLNRIEIRVIPGPVRQRDRRNQVVAAAGLALATSCRNAHLYFPHRSLIVLLISDSLKRPRYSAEPPLFEQNWQPVLKVLPSVPISAIWETSPLLGSRPRFTDLSRHAAIACRFRRRTDVHQESKPHDQNSSPICQPWTDAAGISSSERPCLIIMGRNFFEQ